MKPEPKPLKIVCSNCGMDWEAHGPKPTVDKCVELLKAELARRPKWSLAAASSGVPMFYSKTTETQ